MARAGGQGSAPPQLSPRPLGEESMCCWPRLVGCRARMGGQPDTCPHGVRGEEARELSAKRAAGSESEP